jgi:hypothetical protein
MRGSRIALVGVAPDRDRMTLTSLALLAYLGRCETPDSPFYGDTLTSTLLWLIERSKTHAQGLLTAPEPSLHMALDHALAAQALSDAYVLARTGSKSLPGLREAAEHGILHIISRQLSDGGWAASANGYATQGSSDLWLTLWQIEALASTKLAGLKVQGLSPALSRAREFIETRQTQAGSFGTAHEAQQHRFTTLTAGSLLALRRLSTPFPDCLAKGHAFLSQTPASALPMSELGISWPSSLWLTEAKLYAGGPAWQEYNHRLLAEVLDNQQNNGTWVPTAPANGTIGHRQDDALLRLTLLNVLQLETYFIRPDREFSAAESSYGR